MKTQTTQTVKVLLSTLANLRMLYALTGEPQQKLMDRAVQNELEATQARLASPSDMKLAEEEPDVTHPNCD